MYSQIKDIRIISPNDREYIRPTYRRPVRTRPYGVLDFETYTLNDGRQRAYYLLIYLPSKGYTHLRRCDYLSEEDFNKAVMDYFERYPSLYFTVNGSNFDLLLLNRILSSSNYSPKVYTNGTSIRRLKWKGSVFHDILYWTGPCSLSEMAKTWLKEDVKDVFPYDAVREDMVLSKDSKFGEITREHFSYKVKVNDEDIARYNNGSFWNLCEQYALIDVNITYKCISEIEKLYNRLGYSITDETYQGIASVAYDHSLRFIKGDEFKLFDRELYDGWKDCYLGGIVEVNDLNLSKDKVYVYDINGLYTHVRLKYTYPIGKPQEMENIQVSELNSLFGLIKAVVYYEGKSLLGVPCKVGSEFNRLKGRVLYKGTTEELKSLVKLGAKIEKIDRVLHYSKKCEGSRLWGESIREWENIKRKGIDTGDKGMRAFGKLGNNSAYGKFGLKWDKYNMNSSDDTNLTIGCFIASYARIETMEMVDSMYEKRVNVYYVDTDSFHVNTELPVDMIDKIELGKLKYEGSYDVSYYLGRKQYYLSNSETGEKKIGVKGYNKVLLKEEDWKYASEGGKKTVRYWEFKKEDYREIVKVDREKEFSLSLKGRRYLPEGNSEALEVSCLLGLTAEKRIRASLANTELDMPEIRVLGRANSKAPVRKGWIEGNEDMSIEKILSSTSMYNYSIKTGEVLGKNIHLIVIDIDLKVKVSQSIADRLMSLFKGYYTVKTPNGGYHIYLKVGSEERFKSQHLLTVAGERTTIEIVGEKKKIMAPGSVIEDRMYTKVRGPGWNNSLSKKVIERVDFVSKLSEVGLVIPSEYVENERSEAVIILEEEKDRLIKIISDSFKRKVSIKFVSLIHGSSQGKPNTVLFENGNVYCFRCDVSILVEEYITYAKNRQTDSKRSCGTVKNCKLDSVNEINSLEKIDLDIEGEESIVVKARAGSGKTSYMIEKAMESSKPVLFLAPFVKDCEVVAGMCPGVNRQFGKSETRSQEICSNVMVMTYNSFAFKRYGIKVREWVEKVRKEGILVVDEVDMMMDERFNGCQETYCRLYRKGERWNIVGLSATPDKIYKSMMRDTEVRIYELKEKEKKKHHIKVIKVKSTSGEMAGFLGPNRMREVVDNLKSRLPYKEGHVLMFMDSGEITKESFITNCIFSEGNENIDINKLLRSVGHEIRVKSKDKGIEITQCSVVGSRTYSLNLEGFDNHTNIYVGNYNSDVPEQHFKRLRSHQTTIDNPDYVFITYKMSKKILVGYKRKLSALSEVYNSKSLKIPERYREEVKSYLSMKIEGVELSIDRISRELEEQEKVKYDDEITLKTKEAKRMPSEFEDILSGRYLRGMTDLEHEFNMRIAYCRLNHSDESVCECKREIWEGRVIRSIGNFENSKEVPKWIADLIKRCYENVDKTIRKLTVEKGEERMKRYYVRTNPFIWGDNKWFEGLLRDVKENDMSLYYRLVKLREVKQDYMDKSKDRARLLLLYRLEKGENGYPYGFYDTYLIPVIEYYLSKCKRLREVKEGEYITTDEMCGDKGVEGLSFILGYKAVSKEEAGVSVYRHVFKMERIERTEKKGKFITRWKIIKRKSMLDYLDEELTRHKFKMYDVSRYKSRCGKHAIRITQCKETGRIYDEEKCLVFKDEGEWKMSKNRKDGTGEKMECLISFLKRENQLSQSLSSIVAQDRNEKVIRDRVKREIMFTDVNEPPPDGV